MLKHFGGVALKMQLPLKPLKQSWFSTQKTSKLTKLVESPKLILSELVTWSLYDIVVGKMFLNNLILAAEGSKC